MEQGRGGVVLPRAENVRDHCGEQRAVEVVAGRVGEVLGEARLVLPLHKKGGRRVRRHEGRNGRIASLPLYASRDSRSEELPLVLLADDGA